MSEVYLGKVDPNLENLRRLIRLGCAHFESHLTDISQKSDTCILKPNILPTELTKKNTLAVTNPIVCALVADSLKKFGFKKIILAEGTTYSRKGEANTLEAMKNHGFSDSAFKWEQFDMNKDEIGKWFDIYSPGDEGNPDNSFDIEIGISKLALTYPIISVAKFKSHDVLGLTLSIKNLMGCLTEARRKSTGETLHKGPQVKKYMHGYGPKNPYEIEPRELNYTTSKLALAININRMAKELMPAFSVIDAAPAMEGNGPLFGTANNMNLVLFSNDSVALEAICCKLVGISLQYNQYILNFHRIGLGNANYNTIKVITENPIEQQKLHTFQYHPWFQHSEFSMVEIALLKKYTL